MSVASFFRLDCVSLSRPWTMFDALRFTCDGYLLALQAIEKNLCSLRGNRGGLQIVAQLPDLRQKCLQSL